MGVRKQSGLAAYGAPAGGVQADPGPRLQCFGSVQRGTRLTLATTEEWFEEHSGQLEL